MPDPRRIVNGLDRHDSRIARLEERSQQHFVNDRQSVFRKGIRKNQNGGKYAQTDA